MPESELAKRRLTGLRVARTHVSSIQRSRILAGTVRAIDELGYANTSVSEIVARSRVSRRTFYEMFANRDECLQAVLADTVAQARLELERAGVAQLAWRERVRLGLWTILAFLDREPALARVCVVGALAGGRGVLAFREAALAELAAVVDDGRFENGRGGECTPLTAEGVVGAAFAIVYARLAREEPTSMRALLGELVGIVLLPYLGPAAARRERSRPAPPEGPRLPGERVQGPAPDGDPLQGVRMRVTYRTARVLEGVHEHPGASNRQVADHAGIGDPGQVSKLLRRLERLGLMENRGLGHAKGEPNEWRLTVKGALIADSLRPHSTRQRDGGAGERARGPGASDTVRHATAAGGD
jgi:AcrR family transcriptional regulator/DNA-binding MarR family transcriptional regulator